jgi:F420-non-reducing hydrogenase iron-sulfur subunit
MLDERTDEGTGQPGSPRSWPFCATGAPTPEPTWPGTSRIQYPPNVRVIRVPCSGRVNPIFIVEALRQGADGVLVSGCHPGDCHYLAGNYYARRRFALLQRYLEYLGIERGGCSSRGCRPRRGRAFAEVVTKVTEDVKAPRAVAPAEHQGAPRPGLREMLTRTRRGWHEQRPAPEMRPLDTEYTPTIAGWLATGEIEVFIGYEPGPTVPLRPRRPLCARPRMWGA